MEFVNSPAGTEHPVMMELEPGTTYSWCRCGQTKTVPFCDGSHVGSGIEPLDFTVYEAKTYAICNCGKTNTPPYCDGSHLK